MDLMSLSRLHSSPTPSPYTSPHLCQMLPLRSPPSCSTPLPPALYSHNPLLRYPLQADCHTDPPSPLYTSLPSASPPSAVSHHTLYPTLSRSSHPHHSPLYTHHLSGALGGFEAKLGEDRLDALQG